MSLLSKLFGGGGGSEPPKQEQVAYKGYTITPDPMRDGREFRLSAIIEKDGKSHHLIRAETLASSEAANDAAIAKAKQVIDQVGDRLF